MEQNYWDRFTQTGRIDDYLSYRNIENGKNMMEQYEDKSSESVNYSDRDDSFGNADGRI